MLRITPANARLAGHSLTVFAIAAVWYATSQFNAWLFANLAHSLNAHWIFLPAAFRPLLILLYGKIGALGLALGAYLTLHGETNGSVAHVIMFSIILGLTPWLAISLGKWILEIPQSLSGMRAHHIVVLCMLCAGANAVTLNGYLWIVGRLSTDLTQVAAVFVGDLLGSAIILFLLSSTLALVLPRGLRS